MARYDKQWRDRQRTKIGDLPNNVLVYLTTMYDAPAKDLAEFCARMKQGEATQWKITQETHQ